MTGAVDWSPVEFLTEGGVTGDGTRAREEDRVNFDCYNCGEPGHYAAECGNPPRSPASPRTETSTTTENLPDIDTCYVCGRPGHFAVACKFHPARLRSLRGEACGPGPCTAACRTGDHNDCGFSWCTCPCHQMSL